MDDFTETWIKEVSVPNPWAPVSESDRLIEARVKLLKLDASGYGYTGDVTPCRDEYIELVCDLASDVGELYDLDHVLRFLKVESRCFSGTEVLNSNGQFLHYMPSSVNRTIWWRTTDPPASMVWVWESDDGNDNHYLGLSETLEGIVNSVVDRCIHWWPIFSRPTNILTDPEQTLSWKLARCVVASEVVWEIYKMPVRR